MIHFRDIEQIFSSYPVCYFCWVNSQENVCVIKYSIFLEIFSFNISINCEFFALKFDIWKKKKKNF